MPPLAPQGAGLLGQALSRLSDAAHEGRRDTVSSASIRPSPDRARCHRRRLFPADVTFIAMVTPRRVRRCPIR